MSWIARGVMRKCFYGVCTVCVVRDYFFDIVSVQGTSMQPTLNPREVLLISRISEPSKIKKGDVVVFGVPTNGKDPQIKRVAQTPDAIVRSRNCGTFYLRPYQFWMEGDNAKISKDSNSYGPVCYGLIKGKVVNIIWPPGKWRSNL